MAKPRKTKKLGKNSYTNQQVIDALSAVQEMVQTPAGRAIAAKFGFDPYKVLSVEMALDLRAEVIEETRKEFQFRNASRLQFSDISSEEYRTYVFPTPSGPYEVTIENPMRLNVSASGGHRVIDAQEFCHYIPAGWVKVTWAVRENEPHFSL